MSSDSYKLSGTIDRILEPRQGGQKTFQTVVIQTPGQYPQSVPVEFGEKCLDFIAKLREGDHVECEFSLRGREYNGKYYVNLAGFKIYGEQNHQRGSSSADRGFSRPPQKEYKLDRREPNGRRQDPPDYKEDSSFDF